MELAGGAAATAALLLVAGAVLGVLVDRSFVSPPRVEGSPLTAHAMATRLGLSSLEAARVRALLDSLHADIYEAVRHGPDSLQAAVRKAQERIEDSLPRDARSEFHTWMKKQHEHMTGRMMRPIHGAPMESGVWHGRGSGGAHGDDHRRRP